MLMKREVLRRALSDARSGQVVFVSHCILNQNVRYQGGATRPGAVDEGVARLQRTGVGIVQMPCPEQRAWGGVDKQYTMPAYGADRTRLRRLRRPASWLFLLYTRLAYRRLAGQVARDIGDYVRVGQSVPAMLGVGGSPSCGVRTTLDLRGVLDTIAGCDPTELNTADFNRRVIVAHARAGQGMFMAALHRQLRRRGLEVPFEKHDLIAEITTD
jgi:predicted secreted protein